MNANERNYNFRRARNELFTNTLCVILTAVDQPGGTTIAKHPVTPSQLFAIYAFFHGKKNGL